MERLKKIGTLSLENTAKNRASRIGVGFEKLDRGVFEPEKAYDFVGKLGLLTLHHVFFKLLDSFIDLNGGAMYVAAGIVHAVHTAIHAVLEGINGLIQLVNQITGIRHCGISLLLYLKTIQGVSHIRQMGISLFVQLSPLGKFTQRLLKFHLCQSFLCDCRERWAYG